jgi:hypothetical protein
MVVQSNTKPKFKYGILLIYFGYMKQFIVCMYVFFKIILTF